MASSHNRNPSGKGGFRKGQSGNPAGVRKVTRELRDLCQQYTEDAVKALVSAVRDPKGKPADRIAAARELLDRGHGRAPQKIDANVHLTLEQLVMRSFQAANAAGA